MKLFSAKRLTRAGIIAALYAVTTFALSEFAYGFIQIRPAEALCLLPLLFFESVPALFIGCAVANLLSLYGFWDVILGSLITLIAALATSFCAKYIKNTPLKLILGGLPPVLFNAFGLPIIWILFGVEATYWIEVLSIFISQSVCVYGLGVPLYLMLKRALPELRALRTTLDAEGDRQICALPRDESDTTDVRPQQ